MRRVNCLILVSIASILAGCPLGTPTSPDVSWLSEFSPPPSLDAPADTNPEAARERSLLSDVLATLIETTGLASSSPGEAIAIGGARGSPGATLLPDGRTVLELVSSWNVPEVAPPAPPPLSPPPIAPPEPPAPVLDPTLVCYTGTVERTDRESIESVGGETYTFDYESAICLDPDTRRIRAVRIPWTFATPDINVTFDEVGQTVIVSEESYGSSYRLAATLLSLVIVDGVDTATIAIDIDFECPPLRTLLEGEQTVTARLDGAEVEYSSTSALNGEFGNEGELLSEFTLETSISGVLSRPE